MRRQSVVRRRTATFAAAGDDGRTYTVRVYVWFTPVPCPCGRSVAEVEGRRELETAAGLRVSPLRRPGGALPGRRSRDGLRPDTPRTPRHTVPGPDHRTARVRRVG